MEEQRIFDLKYLCTKKWRVENPTGYFGQAAWGSTYDASCYLCRLAGFESIEEADKYFSAQSAIEKAEMVEKAVEFDKMNTDVFYAKTPAEQQAEQEWIRQQLYEGKQFTQVSKPTPGMGTELLIIIAVFIGFVVLLFRGRK